ncbi:amidinotransferase [Candidatus Saccharibacteria bacterium CG_4_10_14_0_2_um_filter_52_9]|nr:MAG: amidinotransferase [Candidatus Saccharibacteria bacterium CG_4_10_14_0_2_um_filter_52_9]
MSQDPVKRALLCRPTHFNVTYVINPHMRPYSVNTSEALKQWKALVATLESLSITVDIIEQQEDVPDMVFAKDQGIVKDGTVLLANFRYRQRQKERLYYSEWFRDNGFRLRDLSSTFPFEGANTLFFAGMLLVGVGFRASVGTCQELARELEVKVVPLHLVDPYFYLLDMDVLPINKDTAFYYPPALSKNSQRLLQRLVPNLYELSEGAATAFAANSFVSGKDIIIPSGMPESFREDLMNIGLTIHEVDISEFKKAGGGINCLINVLE